MGRFGNVLLINGETTFAGEATVGEVVRLDLVNTANTRLFNFALRGARMKLVGGDSGRYERETFVEDVLLAPSERAVIDVLFDAPARCGSSTARPSASTNSAASPSHRTIAAERRRRRPTPNSASTRSSGAEHRLLDAELDRAPDKVLAFVSTMSMLMDRRRCRPPRPTSARCIPTSVRPSRRRARAAA